MEINDQDKDKVSALKKSTKSKMQYDSESSDSSDANQKGKSN